MALRASDRKTLFKKGIDADELRRRRSETTVQIRKTIKEDRINQRRRMVSQNPTLSFKLFISKTHRVGRSRFASIGWRG